MAETRTPLTGSAKNHPQHPQDSRPLEAPVLLALTDADVSTEQRLAILERLKTRQADFRIRDELGRTALAYAVALDDWQTIKWLVRNGADVNELATFPLSYGQNREWNNWISDMSLVMWCAAECSAAQYRFLKQYGARPLLQNAVGKNAVGMAVKSGRTAVLEQMLASPPQMNGASQTWASVINRRQYLFDAVKHARAGVIRQLLDAGADVNVMAANGHTPLTQVLETLFQEQAEATLYRPVLDLLLSNGADPNLVSPASDPPLIIAIKLGDVELVERLLEAGADTGAEGATAPLLVATWVVSGTEASTLAIVRRLLRAGARTDVTGVGGQNLLSVAAYNNPFLVPLYLRLGLDVNHRSTRRYTPLMYAAHMGPAALDSARLLVEKGADIEAVSMDGWTPLMFAADSLNVPMVNWLLEQGAETMVVNKAGETALDIALKRHSPYQLRADTVDLLRRATAAAGSAALAAP